MCEMTKLPMVDTLDNDASKRPFVKRANHANIDKFRDENDKKNSLGTKCKNLDKFKD